MKFGYVCKRHPAFKPTSHLLLSSLDALEAAEEAHSEFLRSIAQKEAPDPIGVVPTTTGNSAAAANTSQPQAATNDTPLEPPQRQTTRFWNQPRTPAATTPAAGTRMDVPAFS